MILFCIPYAGGSAEAFAGWQEELAGVAEVRAAELPGRGERFGEPHLNDMPRLVAELARQCEDFRSQPYALLGHSFGGAAAFALAQHLERTGAGPSRLFVSGARSPLLDPIRPKRHLMTDSEIIEELTLFGGTDSQVLQSPELMAVYLPILRADFTAFETYLPDPRRVSCPVSVFGADQDMFVPVTDLSAWAELTEAGTEIRIYQGRHFFITTERASVCAAIRADLAQDVLRTATHG